MRVITRTTGERLLSKSAHTHTHTHIHSDSVLYMFNMRKWTRTCVRLITDRDVNRSNVLSVLFFPVILLIEWLTDLGIFAAQKLNPSGKGETEKKNTWLWVWWIVVKYDIQVDTRGWSGRVRTRFWAHTRWETFFFTNDYCCHRAGLSACARVCVTTRMNNRFASKHGIWLHTHTHTYPYILAWSRRTKPDGRALHLPIVAKLQFPSDSASQPDLWVVYISAQANRQ